jgi:hypothetical protein
MRLHSTAGKVETKFIDDHVAGADSKLELPLVEIGTAMVTARPVGNNFCGVWRTAQGAAL